MSIPGFWGHAKYSSSLIRLPPTTGQIECYHLSISITSTLYSISQNRFQVPLLFPFTYAEIVLHERHAVNK